MIKDWAQHLVVSFTVNNFKASLAPSLHNARHTRAAASSGLISMIELITRVVLQAITKNRLNVTLIWTNIFSYKTCFKQHSSALWSSVLMRVIHQWAHRSSFIRLREAKPRWVLTVWDSPTLIGDLWPATQARYPPRPPPITCLLCLEALG